MHFIDNSRQWYLDLIHSYLQGRLAYLPFRERLRVQWALEREEVWHNMWQAARAQRCQERQQLEQGDPPRAEPSDPRRLPRMLDRACNLCIRAKEEEPFRASIKELLAAYRSNISTFLEAKFIDYPPHIAVFERPLPPDSNHHYPCTVEDIRLQLALVPEYDLEGIWAIGLSPQTRARSNAYATYYRWKHPMRKPVILLYSFKGTGEFKLRTRTDPGYLKWWFRVEHKYGIVMENKGSYVICRWPVGAGRRYLVQHTLLHEIGHHVLYQQRWRADLDSWLPSSIHEQFAEDYAIRYNRIEKE